MREIEAILISACGAITVQLPKGGNASFSYLLGTDTLEINLPGCSRLSPSQAPQQATSTTSNVDVAMNLSSPITRKRHSTLQSLKQKMYIHAAYGNLPSYVADYCIVLNKTLKRTLCTIAAIVT